MIKKLCLVLASIAFCAQIAGAAPLDGPATYSLLFKNGTLDDVARSSVLVYERRVTNALKPEMAARDTGDVALTVSAGESPLATLQFRRDAKKRGLGRFPASVGNPMIMYFYESVVRDMAASAGGSAFYIRNRVKEALVQPSEVVAGEAMLDGRKIATRTVRLHPFKNDPNSERMLGFGALTLSVTMSDEVPGWYLSLVAEAPGENGPVYRSELEFLGLEAGQ